MSAWGASNNIEEVHTGRLFVINTGPHKGKTGEAVTFFSWGGVNIRVAGLDKPITLALSDVTESKAT